MSNQKLPGQEHYVNKVDETGLGAVDAVADESAPSSVWGEAWKQLRKRPLFWVAATIIVIAVLMALVPQLFTSQDPAYCTLENSIKRLRPLFPNYLRSTCLNRGWDFLYPDCYGNRGNIWVTGRVFRRYSRCHPLPNCRYLLCYPHGFSCHRDYADVQGTSFHLDGSDCFRNLRVDTNCTY